MHWKITVRCADNDNQMEIIAYNNNIIEISIELQMI